jgi:hypothetical protein
MNVTMRRLWLGVLFSLLAVVNSHVANAAFPSTYQWCNFLGFNCIGTALYSDPVSACLGPSHAGITNITIGPIGGTTPNRSASCIGNYAQQGCYPPEICPGCGLCGFGNSAREQSAKPRICPSNAELSGTDCTCKSGFAELLGSECNGAKNNGRPCPECGNPTSPATGNKFHEEAVYRGAGGFDLILSFNTHATGATRLGGRWRDSFDRKIVMSGANAVAYRPDGKVLQFVPSGGGWATDADTADQLTQLPGGDWQLYVANGDEL